MKLLKKIRKYKLMELHMELVKKGEYKQARLIYGLLKKVRSV